MSFIKFIKSLFNLNDNVETDSPIEGAVDLGLPSGTLWANRNIGANTPEEKGDFFAWGETEPKEIYSPRTYKYKYICEFNEDGKLSQGYTKYCRPLRRLKKEVYEWDNKGILDPEDDVATVKWGSDWCMPTKEELKELIENCTFVETKLNGVEGYKVIGPNKNFIFFPMAGLQNEECPYIQDSGVYLWSKSSIGCLEYFACYMSFALKWVNSELRYQGLTVRAVVNKKND